MKENNNLFDLIYKERFLFLCTLILSILRAILTVGIAYVMQKLIEASSRGIDSLIKIGTISILYMIIFTIILLLQSFVKNIYIKKTMTSYKSYVFENIFDKDLSLFKFENITEYINIITSDTKVIEEGYVDNIFDIVSYAVSFVVAVILLFTYNVYMTLFVFILIFIMLFLSNFLGKKIINTEIDISKYNANFTKNVIELLNAFFVLKSYEAESNAVKIFNESNVKLESTKCTNKLRKSYVKIALKQMAALSQILIFIVGGYFVIIGEFDISIVVAFVQLMNNVMAPIQEIPTLLINRKASRLLIEKANNFVNKNESNELNTSYLEFNDNIIFKDVSFNYDIENLILRNINLEFEKGKSYAIIGNSGCGKSTILKLILGLYTDYTGVISIDDNDIKEINKTNIFSNVSYLQQDITIFDTTLLENITMFKEYEFHEIEKCIKLSCLDKFVEKNGLEYNCGVDGSNLSGGEKQRIAIARALLKNTKILIMDEATSALDKETSHVVNKFILDLEDITKIVVTHNLDESNLSKFDKLIVIQNGEIVEQGSFDCLIENKSFFYSLYSLAKFNEIQ